MIRLGLAILLCTAGVLAGPAARAQDECRGFSEQTVIDEGTNGVDAILALKLDGDDDVDIVTASFGDDKLFWFENDESYPGRFKAHLISDRVRGAADVFAADISGDGRPDLVAAAPNSNAVIWFEQAPGSPPLFTARTITNTARLVLGVSAADVNGDAHVDVLSASFLDDTIAWYEQVPPAAGTFDPPSFTRHVIDDEAKGATSVAAADLDSDGDTDVLSASYLDDTIAWYRQQPAAVGAEDQTPSFVKQTIGTIAGAAAVVAQDLDGDGKVDVLAAAQTGNAIYWWPNTGGGNFGLRRTISDSARGVLALGVADVDGDGVLDVVSANYLDDEVAWYESDCTSLPCLSLPSFTKRVVSTAALHVFDVAAGDLDGDGGVDLASVSSVPGFPASQDKIAWYVDVASVAPPAQPEERRIYRSADGALAAFGADLDGDGDVDVATAGRTDRISWYESDGAAHPAFAEHIVDPDAAGAVDVVVADLDGDGDNDLVTASTDDDTIAWYANDGNTAADADPQFTKHTVSTTAVEARDVLVVDLDADGFLDILSASSGDGKIAWYENDCAEAQCQPSFPERVIAQDDPNADPPIETGARAIHAADVDGDGDLDVLAALHDEGRVRWYENPGDPTAAGAVWTAHDPLDAAGAEFVLLGASGVFGADLDADGDTDIVATAALAGTVLWLENDGNAPPAFTRRVLANDANDVSSVQVVEGGLDGDAFLDILAAVPGDNVIAWFESNGAAPPAFSIALLAPSASFVHNTNVADVNGDALPDVVAGLRLGVSWYEASGEICATFDANGDGTIDGIDLAWIGRAFGMSTQGAAEWVVSSDLDADGVVDGDDLAFLATPGVFGFTTTTCSFICR